ncbi:helix-turn-helix domain-containing protein [Catalinimonas niigatensis]|uniref:helix-turn-helix domain-containing protein n=1 Tax=Catalinimonas niigatensis TaxID=1397264 RepID=UPI0026653696|nr:AraC family transcriptional regulator [Catalinimonas niigatensis]WPP49440.1 AraC family transcriptional regulator [Catalinimonas niigatensis]
MKTELEKIIPDKNSSLSLMVNPKLSDFFFWHFHPEYELVWIKGSDGNRHVGQHFSRFKGSDLVLIGSYIPHLNFDYGITTPYEEVVVHIRQDFLKHTATNAPELEVVQQLLELAQHGIAFGEKTKDIVGPRLKKLPENSHFEQFLELLSIFHVLMLAEDKELLHSEPVKNQYTRKDQDRLRAIYAFIDNNYQQRINIEEVADLSHLSKAAFCRYFKKMTRLTFTEFVNHYRIDRAKKLLLLDRNVTESCYACGFESLSYFNRTFKKVTGKNPLSFKKEHLH